MPDDATTSSPCNIILPPHDWHKDSLVDPPTGSMRVTFTRVLNFPGHSKLLLCTVPGCNSKWARRFGLALYAAMSNSSAPLNYNQNVQMNDIAATTPLLQALEALPWTNVTLIACSGAWQRVAVVRNPYMRVLSKFIDKIVDNMPRTVQETNYSEYAKPYRFEDGQHFDRFVGRLMEVSDGGSRHTLPESSYVNGHFRSMSNFCAMRYVPYTYLHQEELHVSAPALVARLGLSGDANVRATLAELRPYNACADAVRIRTWYDRPTAARVRSYYAEDFRRLGYSPHPPSVEHACHQQHQKVARR